MKRTISLVILLFTATAAYAREGFYIRQAQRSSMKSGDTISELYITDGLIKVCTNEQIILVSKNGWVIYNIKNKTFMEQDTQSVKMMMSMLDASYSGFQITPTGEKAMVGNWKAEKYLVTMQAFGMKTESTVYITRDIKYSVDLYFRWQLLMFPDCPNTHKMLESYRKIGGFQVKSVVKVMGIETTTELLEIKKMDISEEQMKGPENFTKITPPQTPEPEKEKQKLQEEKDKKLDDTVPVVPAE